jgi:hypothetical protein
MESTAMHMGHLADAWGFDACRYRTHVYYPSVEWLFDYSKTARLG